MGNPSGRPINEQEPKAIPGAPAIPFGFRKEEEAYWNYYCKIFQDNGTLNTCDGEALRVLCESSVIRDKAKQLIWSDGLQAVSPQGTKKNSAVTIFNEQVHTIRTLLNEFGLTPASRTKLRVDSPEFDSPLIKALKNRPQNSYQGSNESERPN